MVESFRLESRDDGAWLELRPHDGATFLAQAEGRGIETKSPVDLDYFKYATTSFAAFFASLAADWKGWEGERQWGSSGSEFALRAESDRLGHVTITVLLQSGVWGLKLRLVVEAGQLARIARDARAFEDAVLRAA